MSKITLYSFREAAAMFGVSRYTIADLVRTLGITPKVMPGNGKAKGLDEADMRRLRRAIGINTRHAEAVISTV